VETQVVMAPPPPHNGKGTAASSDFSDHIREIGDKIASLTLLEGKELSDYLDAKNA